MMPIMARRKRADERRGQPSGAGAPAGAVSPGGAVPKIRPTNPRPR